MEVYFSNDKKDFFKERKPDIKVAVSNDGMNIFLLKNRRLVWKKLQERNKGGWFDLEMEKVKEKELPFDRNMEIESLGYLDSSEKLCLIDRHGNTIFMKIGLENQPKNRDFLEQKKSNNNND